MSNEIISERNKVHGIVIGVLVSIDGAGEPLVAYSRNESDLPVVAKSTIPVRSDSIGREVAILFESGDISKPIVMGLIHNESLATDFELLSGKAESDKLSIGKLIPVEDNQDIFVDGERVELYAKREIVLKCGKASITMTSAGKVIIRGTYISTRSSGANRIKGGSVQIN